MEERERGRRTRTRLRTNCRQTGSKVEFELKASQKQRKTPANSKLSTRDSDDNDRYLVIPSNWILCYFLFLSSFHSFHPLELFVTPQHFVDE